MICPRCGKIIEWFYVTYGKKRVERPNVGGVQMLEVSVKSRDGAPPRKGGVVDGQMTTASNNEYPPNPVWNRMRSQWSNE